MRTVMLINMIPPEECRVAILEDGVLQELYIERTTQDSYVGNIYKGRIVNIEPGIQAAFVDFGAERNGFLHISDVSPEYYGGGNGQEGENRRRRTSPRVKPPIQNVFRKGQEVIVQVSKEGLGHKGPTLTTYISIPGRYLVLMPALQRLGVSKKIADEEQRRKLRELLRELNPPKGLGFIVRTAGAERSKRDLARDLAYLCRVWNVVQWRAKRLKAPALLYQESDMVIRTIRDMLTTDVDVVLIDEPSAYERAREFLAAVMPRYLGRLKLYDDPEPLFYKFGIESEIERVQQREVPLREGGSIVIEPTEALVAIDVNSGNVRIDDNAEETAFRVNLAAAEEIARQLRLRDLGGVIINDFIDMADEEHRRQVERALREALRRDRARLKVLRMSAFGIIEMTRQRVRPSLQVSTFDPCPTCGGLGRVKKVETVTIEVYRRLLTLCHRAEVTRVRVEAAPEVANYLSNRKRADLARLQEQTGVTIEVVAMAGFRPDQLEVRCFDRQQAEIPPEYWAPRIVQPGAIEQYLKRLEERQREKRPSKQLSGEDKPSEDSAATPPEESRDELASMGAFSEDIGETSETPGGPETAAPSEPQEQAGAPESVSTRRPARGTPRAGAHRPRPRGSRAGARSIHRRTPSGSFPPDRTSGPHPAPGRQTDSSSYHEASSDGR
jgi:ribonuclease E